MNKTTLMEQSEANADQRVYDDLVKAVHILNITNSVISGLRTFGKAIGKSNAHSKSRRSTINSPKLFSSQNYNYNKVLDKADLSIQKKGNYHGKN